MHIQQAKEEIRNALRAYLSQDEKGNYLYPTVRQRPLLLMGPPGVGKTAIVEQIAREEKLPLVAYTMTHHTRQSAVGLPRILERDYCGKHFSVTEYTMSEIIGAVYRAMEETGSRQGILFLDEINCVSETLAPTMLQFLQNKTFGNHVLPEGWLIVAAGNPPEYNKSVLDFDIVTLDRIRNIQIEPSVEDFLRYGARQGIHGAVMSYLGLKPERFYHVSRDENSLCFVTARGWEDLSCLLYSYETMDLAVDEELVAEFLNLEDTSRDFAAYYRLYRKYGRDYQVGCILSDACDSALWEDAKGMAQSGDFTERFALTGLLLERLRHLARAYVELDRLCVALHERIAVFLNQPEDLSVFLEKQRLALQTKKRYRLAEASDLGLENSVLRTMEDYSLEAREQRLYSRESAAPYLKEAFGRVLSQRETLIGKTQRALERAMEFLTDAYGDGPELTLLLTGITDSTYLMDFITRHGCPGYIARSGRLKYQMNEQALQQACLDAIEKE